MFFERIAITRAKHVLTFPIKIKLRPQNKKHANKLRNTHLIQNFGFQCLISSLAPNRQGET